MQHFQQNIYKIAQSNTTFCCVRLSNCAIINILVNTEHNGKGGGDSCIL